MIATATMTDTSEVVVEVAMDAMFVGIRLYDVPLTFTLMALIMLNRPSTMPTDKMPTTNMATVRNESMIPLGFFPPSLLRSAESCTSERVGLNTEQKCVDMAKAAKTKPRKRRKTAKKKRRSNRKTQDS